MAPPSTPSDPEDSGALYPSTLVGRMEEELRVRGYSERTRRSYLSHVRRYLCAVEYLDGPPEPEEVRPYLEHMLEAENLSHAHVAQGASTLKFFYWRVCSRPLDPDDLLQLRWERKLPLS